LSQTSRASTRTLTRGWQKSISVTETRTVEGHSKRETIRCLKRFGARKVFDDIQTIATADAARPPLEIAA